MKERLPGVQDRIKKAIFQIIAPLDMKVYLTLEPVAFMNRTTGKEKKIEIGDSWGGLFECGWFHFTGTVPEDWEAAAGGNDLEAMESVLLIDINGELCVVDEEGKPVRGLTNVSSEYDYSLGRPGKTVFRFNRTLKAGERIDLWADAGCNDLFGKYQDSGIVRQAFIAVCNKDLEQLYYDFEVLQELMLYLSEDKARYHSLLHSLNRAANELRLYNNEEARRARDILSKELKKKGGDPSLKVNALGHAHIDLAWLWPIRETIRKGARTFSTVLRNMERYPDYVFGASQAQLYQWVKDYYPALYDEVKERIREGRWEVQGAMWVEADTNISGGEALIRQVLLGKRFFQEEFGKDIKNLWLPDVFGYTAALPQILKKSGVDYFMTIKLSWSKFNKHPHHTFWWEGLDGSRILAHMPPEGNYNSSAAPRAVVNSEKEFLDKGIGDECLLLFGIGDGGGGPGEEHLERLKREKNLEGLIPVSQGPAQAFFDRIDTEDSLYKTWKGELYLEFHQGTYTSQGRNKRYNRKMELALRELEFAAAWNVLKTGSKKITEDIYPSDFLDKTWKETLLYQFHDILPGSSIARVYSESLERYEKMLQETEVAVKGIYTALGNFKEKQEAGRAGSKAVAGNCVRVFNSLSWEREEWLSYNDTWIKAKVPAMGYRVLVAEDLKGGTITDTDTDTDTATATDTATDTAIDTAIDTATVTGQILADGTPASLPYNDNILHNTKISEKQNTLENESYVIVFSPDGFIQSIYDKEEKREVIAAGETANKLVLYEDQGDAWDFPIYYDEIPGEALILTESKVYREGPKLIRLNRFRTASGESQLEQKVILTGESRRIDFVTQAAWKECAKMLRTSFPVNVRAQEATCEIQFGNIKRPTHRNTSWDMAKYEVSAHKWVDMSQGDYGVALLNDCKYGHKLKDNVIDLNLLRSTAYPDTAADQGRHEFTYSLYPHKGDYIEGRVVRAGYELNVPLQVLPADDCPMTGEAESLVSVEAENIIVEAVKKCEESGDLILRLYECHGKGVRTKINLAFEPEEIQLVDLMEKETSQAGLMKDTVTGNSCILEFKPFEINTLKISLGLKDERLYERR